jgi:hypothetical protein
VARVLQLPYGQHSGARRSSSVFTQCLVSAFDGLVTEGLIPVSTAFIAEWIAAKYGKRWAIWIGSVIVVCRLFCILTASNGLIVWATDRRSYCQLCVHELWHVHRWPSRHGCRVGHGPHLRSNPTSRDRPSEIQGHYRWILHRHLLHCR